MLLLTACSKDEGGDAGGDKKSQAAAPEKKASTPGGSVEISGEAQRLAGMHVEAVVARRIPQTLTVAGQIAMNEEMTAHIGSYTSGRVIATYANVGDTVKRGAILGRMHSHEVHETTAAYETAKEDVRRQTSAVEFAQRARDRMQRLYGLKYASQQEVERAESDLRSAQANLVNAKISVEREVAHLSDILHLEPASLDKINETTEQVPIIAPLSGLVTARMITPGAVVEPGQEVYTISDLHSVWMLASVNESDIAKIRQGKRAAVISPSYPEEKFAATVTRVNAELDPKTRTLPVRLLVPNPGMKLRVAMYVNAQIDQGQSRSALFLPEEAIQDVNGGSIVFVRKAENQFEARPVQIASRTNGEAEISGGLKPGDAVVIKGSFVAKSEMLKSQIGE